MAARTKVSLSFPFSGDWGVFLPRLPMTKARRRNLVYTPLWSPLQRGRWLSASTKLSHQPQSKSLAVVATQPAAAKNPKVPSPRGNLGVCNGPSLFSKASSHHVSPHAPLKIPNFCKNTPLWSPLQRGRWLSTSTKLSHQPRSKSLAIVATQPAAAKNRKVPSPRGDLGVCNGLSHSSKSWPSPCESTRPTQNPELS